jgi:hypothetical protein
MIIPPAARPLLYLVFIFGRYSRGKLESKPARNETAVHYKTLYDTDRSAFAAMGTDSFASLCSIELALTALEADPAHASAMAPPAETDRGWLHLLRARL